MPDELIAIDLCCGAGGWACAARGLPIRIALAVDLWDVACTTYSLNSQTTKVLQGDLRFERIQNAVIDFAGEHDPAKVVLLGGIPCEWLSTYRHLKKVAAPELATERATLDAVLSIRTKINPRWWCLEDVPQIQKHLPIMTPGQLINSRIYSAQRRKRYYVGDFPPPAACDSKLLLRDKIRAGPYRIGRRAMGRIPQTHRTFTPEATLGAWLDRKGPTVACISSRRDAEWVVVDPSVPGGIRQIEWQEAAQLQGFPEDYLFFGSPSDVATQIGRAIQIDTGRAILTSMCRVAFGEDHGKETRTLDPGPVQAKRVRRNDGAAEAKPRKKRGIAAKRRAKTKKPARRVPGRKARKPN